MLFGLSIGLAVALVVWLKSGQPQAPRPAIADTTRIAEPVETAPRPEDVPESTPVANESESAEPEPGDDFDFFRELPDAELEVPEGRLAAATRADTPAPEIIQAGAFREIGEADSRQAELAQLGIVAEIESALVDGDLWFRVVIGPLTERAEKNQVIRRLQQEGIEWQRRPATSRTPTVGRN